MKEEAVPPQYSIYGDSIATFPYSPEYLENFKRTQVLSQHFFSFLYNHILSGSIIPFASPLLTKLLWLLTILVLACLSTINLNPFEWQDCPKFEEIQKSILYPIANVNNFDPNSIYYSPSLLITVLFLIISIWGIIIFACYEIRKFLTYSQQALYDIFSEWFCFFSLIITSFNCSTSISNYKNTDSEQCGIYLFVPICSILIIIECFISLLRSIYDQRVEKNPVTNTNPRMTFTWTVSILLLIVGKTVYQYSTFKYKLEASWITILMIMLSCYSTYMVFSAPGFNMLFRISTRFTSVNFIGNNLISFIAIWSPPAGSLWGWLNVTSLFASIIISIGFEIYYNKKARVFVENPYNLEFRNKFYNYFAIIPTDQLLEILTSDYVNDIFFEYPTDYDIQILIMRFIIWSPEDFERKRLTIVNLLQKNTQSFHRSIQLLVLNELSEEASDFLTHKKGVFNSHYNNVIVAAHYFWKFLIRENYSELPRIVNWYARACEDFKAIQKQLAVDFRTPGWYGVSYINFISKIEARVYKIGDINIRIAEESINDNVSWIGIKNIDVEDNTIVINSKKYSGIVIKEGKISDNTNVEKYRTCDEAGIKFTLWSRVLLTIPMVLTIISAVSIIIIIIIFLLKHIPIPNDIENSIRAQNTPFHLSDHLFWKTYLNNKFFNISEPSDSAYIMRNLSIAEKYYQKYFYDDELLLSFGYNFNKQLLEFSKYSGLLSFEECLKSQEAKNLINSMIDFSSRCINRMLKIRNRMHAFTHKYIIIIREYQYFYSLLVAVSLITGAIGSIVFIQKLHKVYKLATIVPKTESAKVFRVLREYKDIRDKKPELEYKKTMKYESRALLKYWVPFLIAIAAIYIFCNLCLLMFGRIHDQHEIIYSASTAVPLHKALLYIMGRLSFIPEETQELVPWAIYSTKTLLSAIGIDYIPAFMTEFPSDVSHWNISFVQLATLSTDFLTTEKSNYSKETYLSLNVFTQAVQRALKDLYHNSLDYQNCQFKIILKFGNDTKHFTDALIETNSFHTADYTFIFISEIVVFLLVIIFCIVVSWDTMYSIKETVALVVRLIAGSADTPQLYHDDKCHLDFDMSQYDSGVSEVLDAIPHGILFSDKNGTITYTNDAAARDYDGKLLIGTNVENLNFDSVIDENGEQRYFSIHRLPMSRFPIRSFDRADKATNATIIRDVTELTLMRTNIHLLEERLAKIRKIILPSPSLIFAPNSDITEVLDNVAIVDIALPEGMKRAQMRPLLEQAQEYTDQQVTFYFSELKGSSVCFVFTTVGDSAHQRQYLRDALKFARYFNRISPSSRLSIAHGENVYCKVYDTSSVGVTLYTEAFLKSAALLQYADPGELVVELDVIRRVTELFSNSRKCGKTVISGRDVHYCVIDHWTIYEGMESQSSSIFNAPSADSQIL